MLHHLVPDEVAPDSLGAQPRLLRAAHRARQLALTGDPRRAARPRGPLPARRSRLLRVAARLDLDDLTGTTAAGLHLATMGGLWQALAFGFGGLRIRNDRFVVDPRLPPEWNALELGLRFRGHPFRLRIDRSGVSVDSDSVDVVRTDDDWEVRPR